MAVRQRKDRLRLREPVKVELRLAPRPRAERRKLDVGSWRLEQLGQIVHDEVGAVDAQRVGSFLRHLLRHRARGRRMVLILDNARYHHACLLKPFRRQHRHVLRLDHLPPYSPDLNPIERVRKLTRRLCTHNQYFPELKDLLDAVSQQMAVWQKPNSVLRRLCGIT